MEALKGVLSSGVIVSAIKRGGEIELSKGGGGLFVPSGGEQERVCAHPEGRIRQLTHINGQKWSIKKPRRITN